MDICMFTKYIFLFFYVLSCTSVCEDNNEVKQRATVRQKKLHSLFKYKNIGITNKNKAKGAKFIAKIQNEALQTKMRQKTKFIMS